MKVTVELGRAKKKIKDILDFNTGFVIVLDKIAGEAVDILVNGKTVGKGEVVVIDDNYGVRITEIHLPTEKIS
jgi:flagellar motor switch protein FliN/FliY